MNDFVHGDHPGLIADSLIEGKLAEAKQAKGLTPEGHELILQFFSDTPAAALDIPVEHITGITQQDGIATVQLENDVEKKAQPRHQAAITKLKLLGAAGLAVGTVLAARYISQDVKARHDAFAKAQQDNSPK